MTTSSRHTSYLTAVLVLLVGVSYGRGQAPTKRIALDSLEGLKPMNVKVEPVTYKDRKALRVTDAAPQDTPEGHRFVVLAGTEFQDGVIEVDLAGDRAPGAPETARGFVGIAFRMAPDGSGYECFYLRPYNGRSEDQVRRNHSAQYVSIPEFTWKRLRQEFPEKYETYVDLVPGVWARVKIEVRGEKARLYLNGAQQPTLVVNDLKRGVSKGAIGLWIDPWTVGHFSNLRVSK